MGIPEGFKAGWYPHKITGFSHLNVNVLLGSMMQWTSFSFRKGRLGGGGRGGEIVNVQYSLLVASHFFNQDKLLLCRPFGLF